MIYVLHNQVAQSLAAPLTERQLEAEGTVTQTTYFPVVFNNYQPPEWEYLGLDGDVTDVVFDPANPQHAFTSVLFEGLFETNDGGMTWFKNETITLTNRFYDIDVHPVTSTTWFAAAWSSYSVYQSTDNGQSWPEMIGTPSRLFSIVVHPISSTIMLAGTGNWEFSGGEIYKSVDSGDNWYPVSSMFINALTFAFDPTDPSIVYAGTQHGGIYKSEDGGENWFAANEGISMTELEDANYIDSLIIHPLQPGWLYAATSTGAYVSFDKAENWQPLWEGIFARALLFHPEDPTILYLGTDNGLFVSRNTGLNWSQLGLCGVGHWVNHLAINPSNFNEIWAATDSGLWRCVIH